MQSRKLITVLGVLILISGCSTTFDKRRVVDPEGSFGHSVRNMIRTQTYNPGAAAAVPESGGLDGDKAALALKTYRADKSGAAASSPVNISIGE